MKSLPRLALLFLALGSVLAASPLADNITVEALIVTKAELRRHMAAGVDDTFRPATYDELEASRGEAQPDYLVARFRLKRPGHYSGEAEARIDGARQGTKLNVVLHFNKGWVEYFIPLDGLIYGGRGKEGGPKVAVSWNRLETK
ncbi:hypothetical protein ESB00_18320 [Oleiharenicola lentus]|jgi:hypothetical protein|uniref:Uncharacterized protein n=1 Tax=Oleiharenicola lentus TaxID=2508720 RepID=A0A4Q1C5C6_9BACT|nr:hypothetical protein [Oleiharenicola lentus]RXK53644.1 hypothetical protein ESB00_18320 [Oleiharenicola lentus]